jgi:tubulin-folding cofactor B
VKEKFLKHVGTPVQHQKLILKEHGRQLCEMWDNTKMLGFYSVTSGMEIHIVDTDPFSLSKNGGLTDVSLIKKFKLSDEKYEERKGTMREYIREQKSKDPNFSLIPNKSNLKPSNLATENQDNPGIESVVGMKVGDRCEVHPGQRRGEIKFIGEVEGLSSGYWVSNLN